MSFIYRRWRGFIIALINALMSGTHFFKAKRVLLNTAIGIKIGKNTKIVGPLYLGNCSTVEIGEQCWIGKNFEVLGDGFVKIGNCCDCAPYVRFVTGSHEIGDAKRRAGIGILFSQTVGDGCWLGVESMFMGDIKVAEACVVGARTMVNKDVEPNSTVVGTPAKKLRDLI